MKYLIIDDLKYLDYYLSNLRHEYIPIVLDYYLFSRLRLEGLSPIGIFDNILPEEKKDIEIRSFDFASNMLRSIDDSNRYKYKQLFGTDAINLVGIVTGHYFKRLVANVHVLLRGLELISISRKISELTYLTDENVVEQCTNRNHKAFVFPSDILYRAIDSYMSSREVVVKPLKIPHQHTNHTNLSVRAFFARICLSLKYLASHILKNRIKRSFSSSKNVLVLMPLYELTTVVLRDCFRKKGFNITMLDPDKMSYRGSHECILDLDQKKEEKTVLGAFDWSAFFFPYIQRYIKLKIGEFVKCWSDVQTLDRKKNIDALLWGNPPLRYPGAIILEYCRLKHIPVFGMQHGGTYGMCESMLSHYDTDYSKCDVFFSYGYDTGDIQEQIPEEKRFPEIIPAGSPLLRDFRQQLARERRDPVDVIYPLAVKNKFIMESSDTMPSNILFDIQLEVVNLFTSERNKKIIISYPPSHKDYQIRPFLEKIAKEYPHIKVVAGTPFTTLLSKYCPKLIIVDQVSTTLNQALATSSSLVVYDDPLFCSLTKKARKILSSRAVICSSSDTMISEIKRMLDNSGSPVENDDESFRKYCVCDSLPEDKILETISKYIGS